MPDEKMIQVQGHGEIEATPDVAVINLGVISRESEARAAMQRASEAMQAVIAAVKGEDVPDHAIQTTQLNLHLDQQANVYLASNHVTVRSEEVSKAGAILDAAIEAGANTSSGIQFALADIAQAEQRALELGVADARRKAETLAAALDVTVDQVNQVTTSGVMHHGAFFGPRFAFHSTAGPAEPAPVEAGRLRVTADVQLTYSFH